MYTVYWKLVGWTCLVWWGGHCSVAPHHFPAVGAQLHYCRCNGQVCGTTLHVQAILQWCPSWMLIACCACICVYVWQETVPDECVLLRYEYLVHAHACWMCTDMGCTCTYMCIIIFQVAETGLWNTFPIRQAAPSAHAHCIWSGGHSEDCQFWEDTTTLTSHFPWSECTCTWN